MKWLCAIMLCGALCMAHAPEAGAVGPHEVVLLVNQNSPRSMEVANRYVQLRSVPPNQVIYLSLPDSVLDPAASISHADFTRHIWEPANDILKQRGLDRVLAWVYSADFPIRVQTTPPISLLGATFVRNELPDMEQVRTGQFASRFFMGPDAADGPMGRGASLGLFRQELGAGIPLPSMMLAHMGARGTDMATVERYLGAGMIADGSRPSGTVYFVTGEDVRAKTRNWQFERARSELEAEGVSARIVDAVPQGQNDVLGMMLGVPSLNIEGVGSFRSGSMAEHLTSHAGEFHIWHQRKMTDWLRAGATASAGTVTEPYALWPKFPHARFYAHYARGHSLLESFYLSIRSPMQILLIGDPLMRPWQRPLGVTLLTLEDGVQSGQAIFIVSSLPERVAGPVQWALYRNGEPLRGVVAQNRMFTLDTRAWPDGWHTIRAVIYAGADVQQQAFADLAVEVRNRGQSVQWRDVPDGTELVWDKPASLAIEADGPFVAWGIRQHGRILSRTDAADGNRVRLDPRELGPGPSVIQAVGITATGSEVLGRPTRVLVQRPLRVFPGAGGRSLIEQVNSSKAHQASVDVLDGAVRVRVAGEEAFGVVPLSGELDGLKGVRAEMTLEYGRARHPVNEMAGVVFDYRDPDNFSYFGVRGDVSAWTFSQREKGQWQHRVSRGALIQTRQVYDLVLVFGEDRTVEGYVDGERVAVWQRPAAPDTGRFGLIAGGAPIRFDVLLGWE